MLGYIVLIALQIIVGWFARGPIEAQLQISGQGELVDRAVDAVIFAVLVWVIGLIGSFVLKSVRRPGTPSLASSLIGALIGAAIIVFFPDLRKALPAQVDELFVPLAGAILGYLVRR